MAEPRYNRVIALLPKLETGAPAADELSYIVHEDGIIPRGFDWPAWMAEGERYAQPGGLESADLETCRKLLTVIVRQDRFVDGSLSGHIASGFAARIVARVAELTQHG